MQRKSFRTMQCPIARGLEHAGEWWSILILRDDPLLLDPSTGRRVDGPGYQVVTTMLQDAAA